MKIILSYFDIDVNLKDCSITDLSKEIFNFKKEFNNDSFELEEMFISLLDNSYKIRKILKRNEHLKKLKIIKLLYRDNFMGNLTFSKVDTEEDFNKALRILLKSNLLCFSKYFMYLLDNRNYSERNLIYIKDNLIKRYLFLLSQKDRDDLFDFYIKKLEEIMYKQLKEN